MKINSVNIIISFVEETKKYRNPVPTVDIIVQYKGKIVLISRKNPPYGWAIPGGFVEYGESLEEAAAREAQEETSLKIRLVEQFRVYSRPDRDPRQHTITTVFIAEGEGIPKAADDAAEIGLFTEEDIPEDIVFDHKEILQDYFNYVKRGIRRKL